MTIEKKLVKDTLTIYLEGRLDTATSPDLENEVKMISGIVHLVFDFKKLEYISSAGLRVILSAYKLMTKHGDMLIVNANDSIKNIFEITGFSNVLNIL